MTLLSAATPTQARPQVGLEAGSAEIETARDGNIASRLEPITILRTRQDTIRTSLHRLGRTIHSTPLKPRWGGGLASVEGGFLLATGSGELYYFSRGAGEPSALDLRVLPYVVPLNSSDFERDAIEGARVGKFRVGGLSAQRRDDRMRVAVAHHHWSTEARCFTVRVSTLEGPVSAFFSPERALTWATAFESQPCLPLGKAGGHAFAGHQMGGRLVALDWNRLLLSVGDHEFDGVNAERNLPQDMSASYGKTMLIDLESGEAEVYSAGHRNPQGLYLAPDGALWLTEQGPQGGDELNLIERGKNYGWPLVTIGVNYDSSSWPLSESQGRHDGFVPPIFAWVPSIGISNLVRVEQRDLFPRWRGDLLISSLTGQALWRMRLLGDRAVVTERIWLGRRIRDIAEAEDGALVLWTDRGDIVVLADPSVSRPQQFFPDADLRTTGWKASGASHWSVVDDWVDKGDYTESHALSADDPSAVIELGLGNPEASVPGGAHTLLVSAARLGPGSVSLLVELKEGDTVRASRSFKEGGTQRFDLLQEERDSVGDYTNLSVRMTATRLAGRGPVYRIYSVVWELPGSSEEPRQ